MQPREISARAQPSSRAGSCATPETDEATWRAQGFPSQTRGQCPSLSSVIFLLGNGRLVTQSSHIAFALRNVAKGSKTVNG